MRTNISPLLVDLQYVAAGLTAQLSLQALWSWRRRQSRASLWFSLFSLSLTLTLLANVWLFHASSGQIEIAIFGRSALLMITLCLIVPTLAHLSGRPAPRWGSALLVALGIGRLILWVSTDLVYAHRLDSDGVPVYGPLLAVVSFPYMALVLGLSVAIVVRWDDVVERATLMVGTVCAVAIATASLVCSDPGLAELLTGYWIMPWIAALQVVSSRRAKAAMHRQRSTIEQREAAIRQLATYEKTAELELAHRARHDELTGLANRVGLTVAICDEIGRGRPFALLLLDLDRFKDVNNTLGHTVGNAVLVGVSRRLSYALATNHSLSRLGGDEFALLVPEGDEAPERVAARIVAALEAPLDVGGVAITVRASIGIVRCPGDGDDADTLVRRADSAMYQAKKRGGTWHSFTTHMDSEAARRLRLAGELPEALLNGQIEVHYQPTIALPSGRCHGLEALARWRHPDLGMIAPVEFVPLAEHYGLGPSLAHHVLTHALLQCQRWRASGLAEVVAVNVSPHTLLTPAFVNSVAAALHAARLPREALVLELTEDVFADESGELLDALHHLKALGVGLSIDDFGTGYSSLAYLRRLPVDTIKLDRSFTIGLGTDAANDAIVMFTVELAHRLGLSVVAEGVESPEALKALDGYRCDYAQGYHICRPGPAAAITAWLEKSKQGWLAADR
ncbi:MAG: Diguanylate cyclase protein [Acidimicrobiia bacterium]|nr:Diguanylate cyclase protein [Acidimicrobiia bacterium]